MSHSLFQTINRQLQIKEELGKSLSAMTVFSLSIGYLVEHMMKTVNDGVKGGIGKSDVDWVLTVPAIWSDAAKQFMREAAEQVGWPILSGISFFSFFLPRF